MSNFRFFPLLLALSIMLAGSSCLRDLRDSIDCAAEFISVSLHHVTDMEDPKEVSFDLTYSGSYRVDDQITWDFGDGQSQTRTGLTATHTYASSGNYTVTATVTLRNDDASCTSELTELVRVQ